MPLIDELKCSECDFATEQTAGSYLYTVAKGAEVILGHPSEIDILKQATGLDWHQAREAGLLRSKAYCIDFDCVAQFYLDIDREEKKCTSCGSHNVRTFDGSINERCPSCRSGALRLISLGVS